MLTSNGLIAWFLLIFAVVQYGPMIFERRCPCCGNPMTESGRLELLAQCSGWYWGWRTLHCASCSYQQTLLEVTRGPRAVLYQTHPVSSCVKWNSRHAR